jgi:fibronectin-binding autotransporter adhesin
VLTLSGIVSGDFLTKVGAGVLALTAVNTYTGPNYVNGGVLTGNSSTIRGNIILDPNKENPIARSVDFSQGHDGTFAGAITGLGSLVKTGAGTLTLTGKNSYTNGTTVLAGTLQGTSDSLQGEYPERRRARVRSEL